MEIKNNSTLYEFLGILFIFILKITYTYITGYKNIISNNHIIEGFFNIFITLFSIQIVKNSFKNNMNTHSSKNEIEK